MNLTRELKQINFDNLPLPLYFQHSPTSCITDSQYHSNIWLSNHMAVLHKRCQHKRVKLKYLKYANRKLIYPHHDKAPS